MTVGSLGSWIIINMLASAGMILMKSLYVVYFAVDAESFAEV